MSLLPRPQAQKNKLTTQQSGREFERKKEGAERSFRHSAPHQTEAQRKRVRFGKEDGSNGYAVFAFSGNGMELLSSDAAECSEFLLTKKRRGLKKSVR